MSKLFMAAFVFALIATGAPEAAAKNNSSVTGGFTSRFVQGGIVVRIRSVNINVVRHDNGELTGGIKTTERVYVNGAMTDESTVDADADELVVDGNRAFIRAGSFYFAVEDNGEGSNASPDRSFAISYVENNPSLAARLFTLNALLTFLGADSIRGNVQVR